MKVVFRDTLMNDGKYSFTLIGVSTSNVGVNRLIREDYRLFSKGKDDRHLNFYEDYTGAEFSYDGGNTIWSVVNAPMDTLVDESLVEATE